MIVFVIERSLPIRETITVYSKPFAPRSIGGVLSDGFSLGQAGYAKTWPLALAAQALVASPLLIFQLQNGAANTGAMELNAMALQSPGYSLVYMALALLSAGFQNAMTAQNAAVAQGAGTTMGESLRIGFRLLPRTLLLGLLMVLGFLLIAVCFIIPGFFVGITARYILAASYFVPVFFYLGRIIPANVIFVVEDSGAYASMLRSWHLTEGNYWRTAAGLIALLLVFILVLLAAGFLTDRSAAALVLMQAIPALVNAAFTPFISAVLLSIYYDLKLRKEGSGLAIGADSAAAR
jgi:hypothetical protein